MPAGEREQDCTPVSKRMSKSGCRKVAGGCVRQWAALQDSRCTVCHGACDSSVSLAREACRRDAGG